MCQRRHLPLASLFLNQLCPVVNLTSLQSLCHRSLWVTHRLLVHALSTPIDIIWAVVIVWRIRGKIIRTVQCSVLYCIPQLYTVTSTDTYEQFLQVYQLLGTASELGFDETVSLRVFVFYLHVPRACLFISCFWCISSCFFCCCLVIAWKDSSPKWPIMCRVGRNPLLTHSVMIMIYTFSCLLPI